MVPTLDRQTKKRKKGSTGLTLPVRFSIVLQLTKFNRHINNQPHTRHGIESSHPKGNRRRTFVSDKKCSITSTLVRNCTSQMPFKAMISSQRKDLSEPRAVKAIESSQCMRQGTQLVVSYLTTNALNEKFPLSLLFSCLHHQKLPKSLLSKPTPNQ